MRSRHRFKRWPAVHEARTLRSRVLADAAPSVPPCRSHGLNTVSSRLAPHPLTSIRTPLGAVREPVRVALFLAPLFVLYLVVCGIAQPGPHPVRDEPDLLAAAGRLLDGQFVATDVGPRAYLWHGPGVVALLAPLVALDLPLTAIRFVEPILMACAALLFHRLLRLRLGPRASLAWTYAFGLYVPFFSVLPQVHKEPLCIMLVVVSMLALSRALASGRPLLLAGAGLSLSAVVMVRLEYGWVAVALLVIAGLAWSVRRSSATARRLVAIGVIAVAGCAPWLAYTHHLTGQPLYWGTSAGLSLFWMSPTLAGETGQWHEPAKVAGNPALAAYAPLFRRLAALDPVRSDRRFRELALAHIRARPLAYARNLAANAARLVFSVPMRPRLPPLGIAVYVVFNSLLLSGVAWAAAVLWRRRGTLPPETAPIALFAALATAVHLPASASTRMFLPVVPALLWLVAQAFAISRADASWPTARSASLAHLAHARRVARTS
jgi:hypothetical protein